MPTTKAPRPAVRATSRTTPRAKTVDEYLAAAPKDARVALARIRRAIKAAAPEAVETLAYGLAGYKYKGKPLVYFGYWTDHLSLYGAGSPAVNALPELKKYSLSKGTIRFPIEKPLPDRLVTKIVKVRIREIEGGTTAGYGRAG